ESSGPVQREHRVERDRQRARPTDRLGDRGADAGRAAGDHDHAATHEPEDEERSSSPPESPSASPARHRSSTSQYPKKPPRPPPSARFSGRSLLRSPSKLSREGVHARATSVAPTNAAQIWSHHASSASCETSKELLPLASRVATVCATCSAPTTVMSV